MDHTIVLFTGHLLDNIERISSRFPYRLIGEAGRMIQAELDALSEDNPPGIAISSLAAGGDMLFAAEAVRKNIPIDIFLPFDEVTFLDTSVKYIKDHPEENASEWVTTFHHIISKARSVTIVNPAEDENPYAACNHAMLRHAVQLAGNRRDRIFALALVERHSERLKGGTAEFVHVMEDEGLTVKKVWPIRANKLYL